MRQYFAVPLVALVLAILALAAPATAGTAGTYRGKATSTDRSFKYGKVTMKVAGGRVRLLEIKAVTTSGCGGFMDVVFAPKDKKHIQIVKGSAKLKGGRLSVTYRPDKTVEDQQTTIKARVRGSKVSGTFKSGYICGNDGRFTAKK
jgi:hypothetical protein